MSFSNRCDCAGPVLRQIDVRSEKSTSSDREVVGVGAPHDGDLTVGRSTGLPEDSWNWLRDRKKSVMTLDMLSWKSSAKAFDRCRLSKI